MNTPLERAAAEVAAILDREITEAEAGNEGWVTITWLKALRRELVQAVRKQA
jgi:hypothetical protein